MTVDWAPTRRVTMLYDGLPYDVWTQVEVVRDLSEVCGSFHLQLDDLARTTAALPGSRHGSLSQPFKVFKPVKILIDGELVLVGHIDTVAPQISGDSLGVEISGRDLVGDLIDCAANPFGPVEYKEIKLEDLASALCKPFGITARAEVDTGDPIPKATIDEGETVMSVLEKYARKRRVLIVSDGIGGLILTRSGNTRAPSDIRFGFNVVGSHGTFDGKSRFSPVIVKGQAGEAAGKRKKSAALDRTAAPLDTPPTPEKDADGKTGRESRAVAIMGIAYDPDIERWRPTVRTHRAKGSLKDADAEARWYVSTERGKGDSVDYEVHDWRAFGTLWRPNEMTHVLDPYQDVDKDLLVAGVTFSYGEMGTRSNLRVTGREAYDIVDDGEDGEGGGGDEESTDLDKTAEAL